MCNPCKLCSSLLTLAMIATVGVLLWHFLGRPETIDEAMEAGSDLLADGAEYISNLDGFDWGEMFEKEKEQRPDNGQELSWDQTNGLSLQMLNNLDDTWQDEFEEAIKNWEDSNPQILNLEMKRGQEGSCEPKEGGVQVVCNGNFGENGMLGVNELVFDQGGTILTSVAKMNEFYLHNAEWPERLYTMCHECGHGFGLDHTDENPYNADLYNCMDYTDTPENNMYPDETNFATLTEKYGTISRRLAGVGGRVPSSPRKLSPQLMQSYNDAISDLEDEIRKDAQEGSSGQRGLKTRSGGTYVRRLVDGYSVEMRVLYPRHAKE